jgi:hypothetical protein
MTLEDLIIKEGWQIQTKGGTKHIVANGQVYPFTHPVQIYLKMFRQETVPTLKYEWMKKCHDYLWPHHIATFNYWDEWRFRTHCEHWKHISYAGGAGTGKSLTGAKIAVLYWLADPKNRAVIVASTTLESLNSRIFGYCIDLLNTMAVKIPFKYYRGNTPKVVYDQDQIQHGIFAIAAKQGSDEKAISSWIGRHPKKGILIILDEATDLTYSLLGALPNLSSGVEEYQCTAIGNSNSKFDLHGALSTPKNGWDTVDPLIDTQWETQMKDGTCLFFSCYNSPAIHEKDPIKKAKLSKFLLNEDTLREKEETLGKDSDLFYRFVLGFWKSTSTDKTVMSEQFLKSFNIHEKAEWSGITPLHRVAGLDVAYSTGGDRCLLRIAVLGQTVDGGIVLDYRGTDYLFHIRIKATSGKSAELQIAEQVCDILIREGVLLRDLAIDANGQGRALGGTIYLEMNKRTSSLTEPLKVYSTKGGTNVANSFGMIIKTYQDLWMDVRTYIEHNQIRGLDPVATVQFAMRQIIQDKLTLKQRLESKSEFRKRMTASMPSLAHSPDEADSAALCLQAAIHNYGFALGQRRDLPSINGFAHEKMLAFNLEKLANAPMQAMDHSRMDFNLAADFSAPVESLSGVPKLF